MEGKVKSVMSWALGIGVIALVLLIMLILFGNLQGNIGFGTESAAFGVRILPSIDGTGTNVTDLTGKVNPTLSGLTVINATNASNVVDPSNYTISGGKLIATGPSPYNASGKINISGTLTYDSSGKVDTDNVIFNYTKSATNTASQLPTVGTIIGIAILLTVLIAILVFAIKALTNVGGSGGKSYGGVRFSGSSSASIG
jgi:hypothetical protein